MELSRLTSARDGLSLEVARSPPQGSRGESYSFPTAWRSTRNAISRLWNIFRHTAM